MKAYESVSQYTDFSTMEVRTLLGLALREGRSGSDAATSLLNSFPTLRDLFDASVEELMAVPGVGPVRAIRLRAIIELAKRFLTAPPANRITISGPADVAALLTPQMRHLPQEAFKCVLLNTKHQVIQVLTVSLGTLNASLVHPRELFREAVKRSCAAVILAHNHPSGNPSPSQEDIALTRRLAEAGKLLGIEVLDHVVLGDGTFFSFKQAGRM